MRIAMVTNNYTPYSGGVVSSINAHLYELQKDHEVFLITLNFLGKKHRDATWLKRIWCPIRFGFNTIHLAVPWRPTKQIAQLLQDIQPDIIHVHHPFLLGPAAYTFAKQHKVPIVFTYHTIYEAYAHYLPLPQFLTRPIIKRISLNFCNKMDAIIAPSAFIKEYLQTNGVTRPITVLPSSLQRQFIQPKRTEQMATDAPLSLLVVSRMVKEKNIEVTLRVVQQLLAQDQPITLTLIGYGMWYEKLKSYAYETLKLPEDKVQFIHQPPKAVIAAWYHKADLFLFTSQTDTQGLVLAEAMAGGAAVVALDGPGQRDIIKQGTNGYIVADEQEMVALIKQLSNNRQQLQALSAEAWQTSHAYQPDRLGTRLVAFYREMGDFRGL